MSKPKNQWIAVGDYIESVDQDTPDVHIEFPHSWTQERRKTFAEKMAKALTEAGVKA